MYHCLLNLSLHGRVHDLTRHYFNNNSIVSSDIVKHHRIGKFSNQKIRPIRVVFSSSSIARNVIVKYRTSDKIFINRDLTPMQQKKAYSIRNEFKRRIAAGENDITLKYRNGMPNIKKNQ